MSTYLPSACLWSRMVHLSFKERMKTLAAMAESKVKPTARGPPAKIDRDSKLWSLICLAREVGGDADGIQDYTNLVDEKKKIECELSEKTKEVLRLNQDLAQHKADAARERSTLMESFGEQYKIYDQKNAALETYRGALERLKAEQKTMKDQDLSRKIQLATLESNAKLAKSAHDQLQNKFKTKETDCIVHRSQLQASQAQRDDLESRLRQAREDLGDDFFHDIDEARETNLREQLKSLSALSYDIVKDFMSDPELAMTSNPLLQSLQTRFRDIPLPIGATREAVLMRRAAGQAVICEALMTHILRPFYIPKDFKQAAEQMLDFFSEEKEQQRIFRHQVIKMLDDAEMEVAAATAINAAHAISTLLDRLVSPRNMESFRRKIEEFLIQAAEMWAVEAQGASDLIEVTTPESEDEQLESYSEFGARNTGKAGDANHNIAATLFPRITINGKILHGGVVLWSDSPATLIARDQTPSPTLGRSATFRKNGRRNSVAGHSAA
ncbi:hypothetical protein TOPH_06849 [Tolypocladium ophioglossoides CBS 100239]|uniref:Uncharacterized protein n=1 Tax=Tolypocladium ophioglossoides (strain CBS 100239) TaxID=1163406 RepID=A0A0L0N341_TOLOC|nr:hypothetical protein TOPH_06849 [Tolypocladium ophioglossoides CBS 100239]